MRIRRALAALVAVASVIVSAGCTETTQAVQPSPKSTAAVKPPPDLLTRHLPVLRYHTGNVHFATSAAEMLSDPTTVLRRGGEVIARPPELALDDLGATHYPDGRAVSDEDVLDGARDCGAASQPPASGPPEASVVHGREWKEGDEIWLQYLLFFTCNDAHPWRFGDHAGDWELIQVRVNSSTGRPDLVVVTQHTGSQLMDWAAVEKAPNKSDRPVVYVADGTHALFFVPGTWRTSSSVVHDCADGRWEAQRTRLLKLDREGWLSWPGRWGATRKGEDGRVSDSPRSPGVREVWRRPAALLESSSGPPTSVTDLLPC